MILPDDVVSYLCAIASSDPSGVAYDLLHKYEPWLIHDLGIDCDCEGL